MWTLLTHTPYFAGIRQKGESQNGGSKKAKHAKFSEKRTFLTHDFLFIPVFHWGIFFIRILSKVVGSEKRLKRGAQTFCTLQASQIKYNYVIFAKRVWLEFQKPKLGLNK